MPGPFDDLPDVPGTDWASYQADQFMQNAQAHIDAMGFAHQADQLISSLGPDQAQPPADEQTSFQQQPAPPPPAPEQAAPPPAPIPPPEPAAAAPQPYTPPPVALPQAAQEPPQTAPAPYQPPAAQPAPETAVAPPAQPQAPSGGSSWTDGLSNAGQAAAGAATSAAQQGSDWVSGLANDAGAAAQQATQTAQQAGSQANDWVSGLDANPQGVPAAPDQTAARSSAGLGPGETSSTTGLPDAPVDNSSPTAFAKSMAPYAAEAARELGLGPDGAAWITAMAANETGFGTALPDQGGNNMFGIKAHPGVKSGASVATTEGAGSAAHTEQANFAVYDSPADAIKDYVGIIQRNQPQAVGAQTLQDFNHGLRQGGYYTADENQYLSNLTRLTKQVQPDVDSSLSGAGGAVQAGTNRVLDKVNDAVTAVGGGPPGAQPVEAQRQFEQEAGLSDSDAYSACGPVAATAFAKTYGRNPSPTEAVQLARSVGWTPGAGMAGVDSEAKLLQQMGVDVHVNYAGNDGLDWGAVQHDANSGNPVIIDTPNHYFYVDAYNPTNGAYHVGNSGLVMKGGSEWMTPTDIARFGHGPARAAVFANSPNSPTDSVASQVGGAVGGAASAAGGAASAAGSTANAAVQQARSAVGGGITYVQDAAGNIVDQAGQLANQVASGAGSMASQAGGAAQQAPSAIGSLTSSVGSNIQDQSGALRSNVEQTAFAPTQAVTSAIGSIGSQAQQATDQAGSMLSGLTGNIPQQGPSASSLASQASSMTPAANPLDDFKTKIGDAFTSLLGPLLGQAGQGASSLSSALQQPGPLSGLTSRDVGNAYAQGKQNVWDTAGQAAASPLGQQLGTTLTAASAVDPMLRGLTSGVNVFRPGTPEYAQDQQNKALVSAFANNPVFTRAAQMGLNLDPTPANGAPADWLASHGLDPNDASGGHASLGQRAYFMDIQNRELAGQPVSPQEHAFANEYKSWLTSTAANLLGGEAFGLAGAGIRAAGAPVAARALAPLADTALGQLASRALGTPLGGAVGTLAERVGQGAIEGATGGALSTAAGQAPYLGEEADRNDPEFWKQAAQEIGASTAQGAIFGGGLGAAGAGLEGVRALRGAPSATQAGIVESLPNYGPNTIEARVEAAMRNARESSPDGLAHNVAHTDIQGNVFRPDGQNNAASVQTGAAGSPNIDDMRAMSEANMDARDWYIDGADNGRAMVGEANLPELFTNIGITSQRTKVDANIYEAANTMLAVRRAERDAIANGTPVRDAVQAAIADPTTAGANVTGLAGNAKRASLFKAYDQGTVAADLPKTSSYFGNFVSAGKRLFDPRVTNDVWSWRGGANTSDRMLTRQTSQGPVLENPAEKAAAASDAGYRQLEAFYQELAREKGLQGHQIQATIWAGTKNLQERAPDLWELYKNGRTNPDGTVTPAFREAIDAAKARGNVFTGLGKGDVRDAFASPKVQNVLDRARAEGIDLTSPGPMAASRMAREYQVGPKSAKLPSTEAFRTQQRIPEEAQAPVVGIGGRDFLDRVGYDPSTQQIPWITTPHRIELQGDNAYMHLPGGNSDSARYFGSLFADAHGAPNYDLHYPDYRVENIAGAHFQGSPDQVQAFSRALDERGIQHVDGPTGQSTQIPYAFGNDGSPETLRSITEAAQTAGIDPQSVQPYRGVTDRVDQSSYAADVGRGGTRYAATGAGRSALQERALTELRSASEAQFGPSRPGNEPLGTEGIRPAEPAGAGAGAGLPARIGQALGDIGRGGAAAARAAGIFAAPAESPVRPGADRFYHGTAADYASTTARGSGEQNLYGPGYYVTSSPEVAGGRVAGAPPAEPRYPDWETVGTYPEEGAVQAPGYAQQRARLSEGNDRIYTAAMQQTLWNDRLNQARRTGDSEGIRVASQKLADVNEEMRQAIQEHLNGPAVGPNVRPVDVPRDLNMFDVRKQFEPEELDNVTQAVRARYGDEVGDQAQSLYDTTPSDAASTDPSAADFSPFRYTRNGDSYYHELVDTLRDAGENQPMTAANRVLEDAGYNGIAHEGGHYGGMRDAADQPITHEVRVLFPSALDRTTNALAGTRGGILPTGLPRNLVRQALAGGTRGAFAGAAQSYSQGERDPRELARAALEGGALGVGEGALRRYAPETQGILARAQAHTAANPNGFDPNYGQKQPSIPQRILQGAGDWYNRSQVVRYAGMLSSTATHTAQAAGNFGNLLLTIPVQAGSASIDAARVGAIRALGKEAQRERYFSEIPPAAVGMVQGLGTGVQHAAQILRTGLSPTDISRNIEHAHPGFNAEGFMGGPSRGASAVNALAEGPLRMMEAGDAIFREAARQGALGQLAIRQAYHEGLTGAEARLRANDLLQHPESPTMLEGVENGKSLIQQSLNKQAQDMAARVVLQESRPELQGLRQRTGVVGAMMSHIIPFMGATSNSIAQGLGMTPLGFARVVESALKGNTGEAEDRAARAILGTGIMAVAGKFAADGNMTGDYPQGVDRSTLPPGWQPWSVRVGDHWVSYSQLGPVGVPLAMGSIIGQIVSQPQEQEAIGGRPDKLAGRIAGAFGNYMLSNTMLQDINLLNEALQHPDSKSGARMLGNMIASYVPYGSLQRQIERAQGMATRDPQGALDYLRQNVLPLAGQVPEKRDALGHALVGTQQGIGTFISPARYSEDQDSPTLQQLRAHQVGIPAVQTSVSTPRGDVQLTKDEQQSLAASRGALIETRTQHLTAQDSYQRMSPTARQKALQSVVAGSEADAKEQFLGSIKPQIATRAVKKPGPQPYLATPGDVAAYQAAPTYNPMPYTYGGGTTNVSDENLQALIDQLQGNAA